MNLTWVSDKSLAVSARNNLCVELPRIALTGEGLLKQSKAEARGKLIQ